MLIPVVETSLDVSPFGLNMTRVLVLNMMRVQKKEAFSASFLQLITNSLEQERYTDVGIEGE